MVIHVNDEVKWSSMGVIIALLYFQFSQISVSF